MFLYGADTGIQAQNLKRRRLRKKSWRSLFTTRKSQELSASVDPEAYAGSKSPIFQWWVPVMVLVGGGVIIFLIKSLAEKENRDGQSLEKNPDLVLQTSLQGKAQKKAAKSEAMGDFKPMEIAMLDELDPAWVQKLTDVANRYLKTTDVEEIIRLTRNKEKFEAEIRRYFADPKKLPLSTSGLDDLIISPDPKSSLPLGLLFFFNRNDHSQGIVMVDTKEEILVDWQTLTGSGDMTVEEFLKQKPTTPTLLRVAARLADYYNFEFSDAKSFACLRMTEYPAQNVLYGYVLRSSPLLNTVKSLPLHKDDIPDHLLSQPRPLTIRAKFNEGTKSPNQVQILEIIGNGWFVP
jgi:hypothetical protein